MTVFTPSVIEELYAGITSDTRGTFKAAFHALYPVKAGDVIMPECDEKAPADGHVFLVLLFRERIVEEAREKLAPLLDENGLFITTGEENNYNRCARIAKVMYSLLLSVGFDQFYMSDDERHASMYTSFIHDALPVEMVQSQSQQEVAEYLKENGYDEPPWGIPMLSVNEDRTALSYDAEFQIPVFVNAFCEFALSFLLPRLFQCDVETAYKKYAAARMPALARFFPGVFEGNELARWSSIWGSSVEGWTTCDPPTCTDFIHGFLLDRLARGIKPELKPRKDYVRRITRLFNEGDGQTAFNTLVRSSSLINAIRLSDADPAWEDRVIQALDPARLREKASWGKEDYAIDLNSSMAFLLGFLGKDFKRFLDNYLYENAPFDPMETVSLITGEEWEYTREVSPLYELGQQMREESADFLASPEFVRCNDFDTLHDLLALHQRELLEQELTLLDVPATSIAQVVEEAPAVEWEGHVYTFHYPETAVEINEWSYFLNNCMTSYVTRVSKEKYVIVLVKQDDEPYAALGLVPRTEEGGTIYMKEQFYREGNQRLDPVLEGQLLSALL